VRRTLEPHLVGRAIEDVRVFRGDVLRKPEAQDFRRLLAGRSFVGTGRHGKLLWFDLDRGVLAVHLGMSGQLVLDSGDSPPPPHTHVVFRLAGGEQLRYRDPRRFGWMWYGDRGELDRYLKELGWDPITNRGSRQRFCERVRGSRAGLKSLLMDQSVLAGLGNIYADEVLHHAGLSPKRRGCELSDSEFSALSRAIEEVLAEAIAHGGTTISDYVDGRGGPGQHQYHLRVHGRADEQCYRCGERIRRDRMGGRSTYWCPRCQR